MLARVRLLPVDDRESMPGAFRAEDRGRYFQALEQAQVADDFREWGRFFSGELERAMATALKWRASQRGAGEGESAC